MKCNNNEKKSHRNKVTSRGEQSFALTAPRRDQDVKPTYPLPPLIFDKRGVPYFLCSKCRSALQITGGSMWSQIQRCLEKHQSRSSSPY